MMYSLLLVAAGIGIGLYGPYWLGYAVAYFQDRKIWKEITPLDVDENKLCKNPHAWITARALMDDGPGTVQLCQVCGFIPSINKMATPEAIDRIEENNKIRDIQNKIYKDFLEREQKDIATYFQEEIKNGVSMEKLSNIHGAGMTFGARLNIYKSSRAEEIDKALSKSDA